MLCSRSKGMPWLGGVDLFLSVLYTLLLLALLVLTFSAILRRRKS